MSTPAQPTPQVQTGDKIPEGKFKHIQFEPEFDGDPLVCSIKGPVDLDIYKEWAGKKVVLIAVPGAFTPTCHANHLPPFLQKYDQFKAKGVDIIAVVAANDAFVMSGWGRFVGLSDKILTLSDPDAQWSKSLGMSLDLSARGMGIRTARYALIIDDLEVKYVGLETKPGPDLIMSGADAVLAKL